MTTIQKEFDQLHTRLLAAQEAAWWANSRDRSELDDIKSRMQALLRQITHITASDSELKLRIFLSLRSITRLEELPPPESKIAGMAFQFWYPVPYTMQASYSTPIMGWYLKNGNIGTLLETEVGKRVKSALEQVRTLDEMNIEESDTLVREAQEELGEIEGEPCDEDDLLPYLENFKQGLKHAIDEFHALRIWIKPEHKKHLTTAHAFLRALQNGKIDPDSAAIYFAGFDDANQMLLHRLVNGQPMQEFFTNADHEDLLQVATGAVAELLRRNTISCMLKEKTYKLDEREKRFLLDAEVGTLTLEKSVFYIVECMFSLRPQSHKGKRELRELFNQQYPFAIAELQPTVDAVTAQIAQFGFSGSSVADAIFKKQFGDVEARTGLALQLQNHLVGKDESNPEYELVRYTIHRDPACDFFRTFFWNSRYLPFYEPKGVSLEKPKFIMETVVAAVDLIDFTRCHQLAGEYARMPEAKQAMASYLLARVDELGRKFGIDKSLELDLLACCLYGSNDQEVIQAQQKFSSLDPETLSPQLKPLYYENIMNKLIWNQFSYSDEETKALLEGPIGEFLGKQEVASDDIKIQFAIYKLVKLGHLRPVSDLWLEDMELLVPHITTRINTSLLQIFQ
ncbi:MAG: hypothetical protein JSR37_00755 [Verrucomicrobia bacterium]|nr:hypothetical protein [Verrucomicrobiota bacterium]MBS0637675.1 hypothetical protein [Verrucomicrobiota bacterium]